MVANLCKCIEIFCGQNLLYDLFDHGRLRRWRRDHRGGTLPAVGQHRTGQKDGFAPPLLVEQLDDLPLLRVGCIELERQPARLLFAAHQACPLLARRAR